VTGWIIAAWAVSTAVLLALLLQTRRQLVFSRESFVALSKRAPVGFYETDAAGQCSFVNDTWCEISGLSISQSLGTGWVRAVHPDDQLAALAAWEGSVHSQKPYLNELRLVRPDGSLRQVLVSGRPIESDRGRASGFIGTVLDVTELRRAQQQAREKESLLQTLVDHSSAAIYLKDTAGRYLLINRRHVELWPQMKDFRPGTTVFDWFPEETARSFLASDHELVESRQTKTFEEVVTANEGKRTYLSVKFPVFGEDGEVVAVGGISADVTELEQAHQALAEREKLLRSLIEVQENERQLLCHEFHDGLIQYAVGSKMLLESLRNENVSTVCADAVGSVIDCLAKGIEEGRRVIRGIRPAALDDLGLRAALDDLANDLGESGMPVTLRFDPGIDSIPSSLQTTVYRVAQESLTNARKHSDSDRVCLMVLRVGSRIEVTARDFGRGFDPQGDTGHGFGLIGIRERARLAGGECRVESEQGRGTTVTVELPLPDDDNTPSLPVDEATRRAL
jgi:PAS domain S-box-containing protein